MASERSDLLSSSEDVHPFTSVGRRPRALRTAQMVVMAPVVLVRLLLIVLLLCLAALGAGLCSPTCGRLWVRACFRLVLFVSGFYWLRVDGDVDTHTDTPVVIVANHVGYFDFLSLISLFGCGVAAGSGVLRAPLLGPCLQVFGSIPVDRATSAGRQSARQLMVERVEDPSLPPLLVFAEGCTSHDRALTSFRAGAFRAGCTVQPVCISYPTCCQGVDYYHGQGEGTGLGKVAWNLAQLWSCQRIQILPLHPCKEEYRADPLLHGAQVRLSMGQAMGASISEHSYADVQLCIRLRAVGLPMPLRSMTMQSLKTTHGLTAERVHALVATFAGLETTQAWRTGSRAASKETIQLELLRHITADTSAPSTQ